MKTIPGTILKILDVPTYSESEKPPVMVKCAIVNTEKGRAIVTCEEEHNFKAGDKVLFCEGDLCYELVPTFQVVSPASPGTWKGLDRK